MHTRRTRSACDRDGIARADSTSSVAAAGNTATVDVLLSTRANVNARNRYGDTALMVAALTGRFDLVKKYRSRGADVNQPGWTAQMRKYIADDPLLFQGEACEAMFRAAWEVCNGTGLARQNTPPPTPRGGEPVSTPKPQGFGLGAGDYKGDAEWIWCMQCDLRRTRDQAAGCVSRFCRIKHHGSAGE